jgi:hypothetical protein
MAQPIQPFLGGGGYGNVMAPSYQQVSRQVGDEYISRENAKVDSAQQALNSIIGMGAKAGGADPLMASKMLPSSINEYYAQASELDKKSNAMKKMLELNPELFGLNQDQAKQLGNVTSKMSSTERHAFFQDYVPTLFKAQQAKLEQAATMQRAQIGVGPQYAQLEEQRRQREQDARNREATNRAIEGFGKSLEKYRGVFGD